MEAATIHPNSTPQLRADRSRQVRSRTAPSVRPPPRMPAPEPRLPPPLPPPLLLLLVAACSVGLAAGGGGGAGGSGSCDFSVERGGELYSFTLAASTPAHRHGVLSEDGFYKVAVNDSILWFQLCDEMIFTLIHLCVLIVRTVVVH